MVMIDEHGADAGTEREANRKSHFNTSNGSAQHGADPDANRHAGRKLGIRILVHASKIAESRNRSGLPARQHKEARRWEGDNPRRALKVVIAGPTPVEAYPQRS